MKTLNVMSYDFGYKAAIMGYETIVLERVFNGCGYFRMTINSEVTNANLIAQDDIVWFDNEYHKAYIVEKIEEVLQGDSIEYSITGSSLNSLLKDLITVPPDLAYDTATGTREEVARQWVSNNITRSPKIALGTLKGYGDTVTDQTRYGNLSDEVIRVLSPYDLGHNLAVDLSTSKFVFNVLEGTDRTIENTDYQPRVLFGLKYGNIAAYKKLSDNTPYKNVAYVAGQGEGSGRTIEVVDNSAGRRREVFVDARDIDIDSELQERGQQVLSEQAQVDGFEFEVLDRQFKYEVNYDLGDFVTVVLDTNTYQNLQITKVIETYQKNAITTSVKFGKSERSLVSVLKNLSTKTANLEARVGVGTNYIDGGTPDSVYGGLDTIDGGGI